MRSIYFFQRAHAKLKLLTKMQVVETVSFMRNPLTKAKLEKQARFEKYSIIFATTVLSSVQRLYYK